MDLTFKKNSFIKDFYLCRQIIANLIIIVSLSFVIFENLDNIRYTNVNTPDGTKFILDRITKIITKVD